MIGNSDNGARVAHGSRRPRKSLHQLWPLIYGTVLAAFTAFVLLDTFVIPKRIATTTTSATFSQLSTQAANAAATVTGTASTTATGSATTDSATTDDSTTNSSTAVAAAATVSTTDSTTAAATTTDAAAATTTDTTTTSTPTITATSYSDDNIQISISTLREYDTDIYVVDVQVSSAEYLKTALAQGTYGRNLKETTSAMATENNAILAINGDYYGFRDDGFVIRNGVLYRDTASSDTDALVIGADGTLYTASEDTTSASDLLSNGAWQVLSFGPTLVSDGQIAVGENTEVDQARASNPRTAIGMISPLHYVIIVSDGRTSASAGLSLYQLAQVFQEQGCTIAYNLDGGGSSTLWFNGSVINNPTDGRSGGERSVSDIVYIGY